MSIYANGILSIPAFFYQNMQIFKAYYGNDLVYQLNKFDCYLKNGFCINSPVYQRATGINSSYIISNWTEKTVPQQTSNFGAYTAYTNSQRRNQGFYLVGPVKNVYFSNLENFAYGINIKRDTFSKFHLLSPENVNSMNNAFRNCNIDGFNFFNVSFSDSNIQYMKSTFANSNLSNINITIKNKSSLASCFHNISLQNVNIILDNILNVDECFYDVPLKYLNNNIYLNNIKNLRGAFSASTSPKNYPQVAINIPNGAENISYIFYQRMNELQEVTIPGSIVFTNGAFSYCKNLKRVYVKDLNHSINCNNTFDHCDSLTDIYMINSNYGFEKYFFGRDSGYWVNNGPFIPSGGILNIFINNKDNYYFGYNNLYIKEYLKPLTSELGNITISSDVIYIKNINNMNYLGAFSTSYGYGNIWTGQIRFLYNQSLKEVENNFPIINKILWNRLEMMSTLKFGGGNIKIFNTIPNSLYTKYSNGRTGEKILFLTDFNRNAPEIIFYNNVNNRTEEFYINSSSASPKLYFEENSNLLFYNANFISFDIQNFFNVFSFEKVKNAYGMCLGVNINDNDIFFLENANDDFMYAKSKVIKAKSPNYIKHMNYTYAHCENLTSSACGDNVVDMIGTYYNCEKLNIVNIGSNVTNMAGAYALSGITNINITIPNNVLNIGAIIINNNYYGAFTDTNISWTDCGPNVIDMSYAYANCGYVLSTSYGGWTRGGILSVACGDNVINMRGAYYNCNFISAQPVCGNNVIDFSYAYALKHEYWSRVVSVGQPVCGPNVQNFSYTYSEYLFRNMENHIIPCGENVINMVGTYFNCSFHGAIAPTIIIGSNVIDASNCFCNCKNLENTYIPNLPNTLLNMCWTFSYTNMKGKAQCPDSVINMVGAYQNCGYITEAACGNNVINMREAYINCFNIKEPVCGDNVIDMSYTYENCFNLTNPICGSNVVNMSYAYNKCYNLTKAVCGKKVTNMEGAYSYCTNIINPICGNNVVNMRATYMGCTNILNPVCGNNVIDISYAYEGCKKITEAICTNNIKYMDYTYLNCTNLVNAVCGPKVIDMWGTYSNCTNLVTIPSLLDFPEIKYLTCTFENCKKLNTNNISLPNNIISINRCFCNVNKRINICITKNSITDKTIQNSCLFNVNIDSLGYADHASTYNYWSNNLGYDDATNNLYVYYK